jgi:predicted signal transduction protein with EAL and GGDEF domain
MTTLAYLAARLVHLSYWYCVDFMVNLGNLTHTSYNEANTWVLLLGLPGLLVLLIGVRVAQWFRLRRLRRR